MASSLRIPPQSPTLLNTIPTGLIEDVKYLVDRLTQDVDDLVERVRPEDTTFATAILPFIKTAIKIYQEATADLYLRDEFFQLVDAVLHKDEQLDPESQYYIRKLHDAFFQKGLGIPKGPLRDRYWEIQKNLGDLRRAALRNLDDSGSRGLWFTSGFPHTDHEELGSDPHAERRSEWFWIRFKEPDTIPVLKFVSVAETRRKVYMDSDDRCPENVSIVKEMFVLRDEAARLMGFKHHAAFMTRYKMVGNPEAVSSQLNILRQQFQYRRDQEKQALLALKHDELADHGMPVFDKTLKLFSWDRLYYDRILKERDYSFDQNVVADYFSLENTLEGMYKIYSHIFGIDIHKVEPQGHWTVHESVSVYEVWDNDQNTDFLGYLYIDVFPREGKFTHTAHYTLSHGYNESGKRHFPANIIIANFPPPTSSKPSLLKHEELKRIFHEPSHAMHDLLAKTKYARLHNSDDKDFTEAPSMMFENFFWDAQYMRDISCHYSILTPEYAAAWRVSLELEPGDPIPEVSAQISLDLATKLATTKNVGSAFKTMSLISQSTWDMLVHSPSSPEDLLHMDYARTFNTMRSDCTGLAGSEAFDGSQGLGFSVFRAYMSGYDAGYYTYLLSQVYSYDLFYTGFKGDIMNPAKGRRYRYLVLQPGGSQREKETIYSFLEQESNTKTLCEEHGLDF
ncbi:hypothetical protein MMC25_003553 [Agyrium rufum]|nr:hypothetical protein [Agyrium rufum]